METGDGVEAATGEVVGAGVSDLEDELGSTIQ